MSNKFHDYEYHRLVRTVLDCGVQKGDRTGTGTISYPFQQMRFDLSNNSIPLLTTKKMFTRGIIHEILWYLKGDTNIKYLTDNNVHIWDEWADDNGDLGPVYGEQWRSWKTYKPATMFYPTNEHQPDPYFEDEPVDQVANVIHQLRTNPNDRRMIVCAWNPATLPDTKRSFSENVADGKCALPPCHALFQFWTDGKDELKCHLYQRSCDVGLGVPFNIVQYSILTHMIAHVTGFKATEFVWTGGDIHIYNNHIDSLTEQLTRTPYPSPTLRLNPDVKEIDDFKFEDFEIVGYDDFHPTIKMEVSV